MSRQSFDQDLRVSCQDRIFLCRDRMFNVATELAVVERLYVVTECGLIERF